LLPIVLTEMRIDHLFNEVNAFPGYKLIVDLQRQMVIAGSTEIAFDVDAHRKDCLLNGFDDIGLSLRHADKIRDFEAKRRIEQPWLFG
jgi:3-isopropylmalate/(R)-2-methylmalate dehydratase small subunit